jgi:heat-inducible transcriptional repressor
MDDVQIFIGSENRSADLRDFGVVMASYGASDEITGYLGVLGPTRMPYGRSISMVRYLAQVLSDLLQGVYQADPNAVR